jgi:hypothetical protein
VAKSGSGDPLDYVPEDVLEEVRQATSYDDEGKQKGYRRKPYPTSRDVVSAVVTVLRSFQGTPDEFPEAVLDFLSSQGFNVKFVTVRRIWRTYENLARRGVISDRLGVLAF